MIRDRATYDAKNAIADNAVNAYNKGKYEESITYWNNFLQDYYWQSDAVRNSCKINFAEAFNGLKLAYVAQAEILYEKWQIDNTITYLWKALQLSPNDFEVKMWLWYSYYANWDNYNSIKYFSEAYNNAPTKNDTEDAKSALDFVNMEIKYQSQKINAATNDKYLFLQYYIKDLNIDKAWKTVTNTTQVTVAVIDDGISINHPDLLNSIWNNTNAKYWSSKIINFAWDTIWDNLPTWDHWTMVSWIIWATQNNNEWIAGIAKNVKIMPLRVFGTWWVADETNIIKAIDFAVDNWANIINLSLWWSQFAYSEKYDEAIMKAYKKWVIVVIAAGNWDVLSWQEVWVNLNNNPVSPICNNWWKWNKYSIWVFATDSTWMKTKWTNYWDCTPFMAPWVWILWTSIPLYNSAFWYNYNLKDWTSFSAPILSWIIALWYNKYWYVSPDIVFDSLKASLTKNSAWNEYVDAVKYLDILWTKSLQIKQTQATNTGAIVNNNTQSTKTQTWITQSISQSNWDALVNAWIVKKQDNEDWYRLNDFVLRQEVIWMAIKLWGFSLPENYSCKWYFKDVSTIKPNNWACRVVEISADNSIITKANSNFRPEDKITKIEALAILLKWAKIDVTQFTSSNFSDVSIPWQINIVNTALNKKIVDQWNYFFPNQNATRWEIFEMAKRILSLNK